MKRDAKEEQARILALLREAAEDPSAVLGVSRQFRRETIKVLARIEALIMYGKEAA